MAFTTTPVSTTTLSTNQFPVSAVAEPGLSGASLTALEGGPGSVDSNGNRTAPASMYIKGGSFIDFGAQADSAASTDTGTFSFMALFKRSLQKLTSLVTNTNAFASLGTDQAGAMIKVSLYGTNAVAGDTAFPINASGNVKMNINGISGGVTLPVRQGDVTGSGSITAAQSTQDTPVANATVAITLGNGQTSWAVDLRGTFSAGTTINFDGTINGTNWFSINGVPVGSTSDAEVSSVAGGAAVQYQGNASDLQQVRVRASVLAGGDSVTVTLIGSVAPDGGFLTKALPPGSASIGAVTQGGTWTVMPGNTPNTTAWKVDASSTTVPVSGTFWQATQPVSGTVTANAGTGNFQMQLVDSGGTNKAAIDSAGNQQVKSGFTEQASLSAGSLNADLLAALDVSAYKQACLMLSGTWSGTLTVQGSNDNFVNQTVSVSCIRLDGVGTVVSTATGNIPLLIPLAFRYLRIRMTAYTSGTANGVVELYTIPVPMFPGTLSATLGTGVNSIGTVQPGNTANTTPWLTAQANNNASVPSGAANTVIKASAGAITSIVVTTAGTGAGNVVIYDNASTNSGTPLAVIPATVSVGQQYQVNGWAKVGMTAANVLNGPVFTVYYA